MKKFLCLIGLIALVSCSKENGDVDVLDGVYMDENKWCCIIINEFEKGNLGYYTFDMTQEKFTDSYTEGLMSIKKDGKDSIAIFTVKKNKVKPLSGVPIMFNCQDRIKLSNDVLCLGNNLYFKKVKATGEIKTMKDAVRAGMVVQYGKKYKH